MKSFFTTFLICFSLSISAQTFTNYTDADGLINNTTNCLAIDANDNVWFGTQEGVSFFDGETWTNYNTDSHPDMVNNTIIAIAVDSDNNVWLGTDFGLNKFDGTNWTTYTDDDGLADNRVKYIKEGPNGNMWIANNDGISIFNGSEWTSYLMADGLPFGGTNYVAFDAEENAWLGTPLGGIFIFDGTDFSEITEDEGLLNDKIRSIAISDNAYKWVGTSDGISVFDGDNNWVINHELIFELPPPDTLNPVEDVQIDSEGNVWVGVYVDYLVTEGGISFFDGSGWDDYDAENGLIGPVVRRLAIDSEDNAWVATSTGVSKVTDLPTGTLPSANLNNKTIKTYPNPASSVFTLAVPNRLIGTNYELFNHAGSKVLQGSVTADRLSIKVTNIPSGIYFLLVDGVYGSKIVVE